MYMYLLNFLLPYIYMQFNVADMMTQYDTNVDRARIAPGWDGKFYIVKLCDYSYPTDLHSE